MVDLGLVLDHLGRSCMSVMVRRCISLDYISLVGRLCFPSPCFYDESFLSPFCTLST